jgi:hypothetical protein
MGAFQDVLIAILDNAEFVESVSYIPAGELDPVLLNARIVRDAVEIVRTAEESRSTHRATAKVLSVVHATHKGIVSPRVGEVWQVPLVRGGSVVTWRAGAPKGGDGKWEIPLTYEERIETGGNRMKDSA